MSATTRTAAARGLSSRRTIFHPDPGRGVTTVYVAVRALAP
jgi:hypothetical protein